MNWISTADSLTLVPDGETFRAVRNLLNSAAAACGGANRERQPKLLAQQTRIDLILPSSSFQNHLFVESYLASFGKHISRRKSVRGFRGLEGDPRKVGAQDVFGKLVVSTVHGADSDA
jgi:hypothetical protein